MRIFLTGVSCIGKTTIGSILADLLGYRFFDLDMEIERFFETSIERLQNRYLTLSSYRQEASKALKDLLSREESKNCVIALPPSGLMDNYWRVVKTAKGAIVVLQDEPRNILKRITFFDIDSRPIHKNLTDNERCLYLRRIKEDITYFRRSYKRANLTVDIAGFGPEDAAHQVKDTITQSLLRAPVLEPRTTAWSGPG